MSVAKPEDGAPSCLSPLGDDARLVVHDHEADRKDARRGPGGFCRGQRPAASGRVEGWCARGDAASSGGRSARSQFLPEKRGRGGGRDVSGGACRRGLRQERERDGRLRPRPGWECAAAAAASPREGGGRRSRFFPGRGGQRRRASSESGRAVAAASARKGERGGLGREKGEGGSAGERRKESPWPRLGTLRDSGRGLVFGRGSGVCCLPEGKSAVSAST